MERKENQIKEKSAAFIKSYDISQTPPIERQSSIPSGITSIGLDGYCGFYNYGCPTCRIQLFSFVVVVGAGTIL